MPPDEPKMESTNSQENFELESQFILRLPSFPAASLRAAIKSGVLNLKDRLTIQIDQDMRNGIVRFDDWVLSAKIVDLPTILESHKTLDNKNFYKTADINQLMVCKEEMDEVKEESEEVSKKTKDGREKKYLYPHGITKPLKNVRKRRFRRTLRKKYVDFPEIEKEVKRLLRTDNDAKSVRFEIVNTEDDNKNDSKEKESNMNASTTAYDVGVLFGENVSSSDDDDDQTGMPDMYSDEGSRMSNTFRDYLKDPIEEEKGTPENNYTFSQMLKNDADNLAAAGPSTSGDGGDAFDYARAENDDEQAEASFSLSRNMEDESLRMKLQELEGEIQNLQTQRLAQQMELDSIENMALKQRFQSIIDELKNQEQLKKKEYEDLKKSL